MTTDSLRPLRRVHRALVWLVLSPVVFYRAWLSPLKRAPSCIYLPTCSEYAMEAVKTRGIFVGIVLAAWRILRCNPFFHGGLDPVPCRHHAIERSMHVGRAAQEQH